MRRGRNHPVWGAFAFALLGVFAVSSALMALFGAQAYRSAVERSEAQDARRVLTALVRNAVRADDAAGAVSVVESGGVTALRLDSETGGERYSRYLYVSEGALRELFVRAGRPFDPAAGEALCAAQSMEVSREDGLLTATLTDAAGERHAVAVAPRAAG